MGVKGEKRCKERGKEGRYGQGGKGTGKIKVRGCGKRDGKKG